MKAAFRRIYAWIQAALTNKTDAESPETPTPADLWSVAWAHGFGRPDHRQVVCLDHGASPTPELPLNHQAEFVSKLAAHLGVAESTVLEEVASVVRDRVRREKVWEAAKPFVRLRAEPSMGYDPASRRVV